MAKTVTITICGVRNPYDYAECMEPVKGDNTICRGCSDRAAKIDADNKRRRFQRSLRFTVTEKHLALLGHLNWHHYPGFAPGSPSVAHGSPAVNSKRPYGNSDVYADMAKILGIEGRNEETWEFPEGLEESLQWLHYEMHRVLEVMSSIKAWPEPGVYERDGCSADDKWVRGRSSYNFFPLDGGTG